MDMTTLSDVLQFKKSGSWRGLVRVAFEMVRDAEQRAGVAMHPKLGGGTRLMLAFDHRIGSVTTSICSFAIRSGSAISLHD